MLSKFFKNQKDQEDFAIALVVIALAGILIGYFTFYQDKSIFDGMNTLVTQNTRIDTLQIDGSTYVAVQTDEMLDESPPKSKIIPVAPINTTPSIDTLTGKSEHTVRYSDEEIDDEGLGTQDIDDVGITESTKDLLDSVISDEDELLIDEEPIVEEAEDVQPEMMEDIPAIEEPEEEPTEEETVTSIEKQDASPRFTPRSKCIVVIGAYSNKTNIHKLIGRLDQEGYPVFKVPFRGLTRVGAYIDCEYSTSLLEKIRRDYSADAFLMKSK